jgi:5-methylcytosine-specific restriction endonuclease McrA
MTAPCSCPQPHQSRNEAHACYMRRWYRANLEKVRASEKKRSIKRKAERAIYTKAWREKNRERLVAKRQTPGYKKLKAKWRADWIENNRVRHKATRGREYARIKNAVGFCSFEQLMQRVAFFGWSCRFCHKRLTLETLTIDHAIPLCRGGTHWPANLGPACKSCNCRKQRRTIKEFNP